MRMHIDRIARAYILIANAFVNTEHTDEPLVRVENGLERGYQHLTTFVLGMCLLCSNIEDSTMQYSKQKHCIR